MSFNVSYDIISLLVLLVLLYHFFRQKNYPVFSNRLYGVLLILGTLNVALDMTGSLVLLPSLGVPVPVCYAINILFYLIEIVFPATLVVYLLALVGNKETVEKKTYIAALVPAGCALAAFAIGMPKGLVFTIAADHTYGKGPLSLVTYVTLALYLFLMIAVLLNKKKLLSRNEHLSFIWLAALVILSSAVQFFYPSELLTGSAIAISFLIMYFTIQNPQMMLDPDTGLFNSKACAELLPAAKVTRRTIHAASIEIHDLHNIYMLYGHETGDRVLRTMGDYLLSFRKGWAFRTGDATFLLTFTKEEDLDDFLRQFEEKRKTLLDMEPMELVPQMTLLCVRDAGRIGGGKELMSVFDNAMEDRSLQRTTEHAVCLEAEDIARYQKRLVVENVIRKNLHDGENFRMYYQPIYSQKKKRFVSAEALVRYHSEELGYLSPGEFIPLIEEKGLATELDEMVIRKVFQDIKDGKFEGLGYEAVHVNLTAVSFSSENLIRKVISIADSYGIDHSFVIFEITETATVLSESILKSCASMLRNVGFGFALDDFGTGYASMARLTNIPFTHAKLDRDIVRDSVRIIGEIVRIFHTFDMDVVAEGVETEEQVHEMENAGIDLIQGYYYAKPVPPEKLGGYK